MRDGRTQTGNTAANSSKPTLDALKQRFGHQGRNRFTGRYGEDKTGQRIRKRTKIKNFL
jgi:hypothetical protein